MASQEKNEEKRKRRERELESVHPGLVLGGNHISSGGGGVRNRSLESQS